MSKKKLIKLINIILALFLTCFCSCSCPNESEKPRDDISELLLSSSYSYVDVLGAENEAVKAGGKTLSNGFVLQSSKSDTSYISIPLDSKYSKINFYVGALQVKGAHHLAERTFKVTVDGVSAFQKKIRRSDVAELCTLDVSGARNITFSAYDGEIALAVGNIGFEDVEKELECGDDIVKLIKVIEPYCYSTTDKMDIIRSDDNESFTVCGNEYTDGLKVYFPLLADFTDEIYAYFNLEGKYKRFSFSIGGVSNTVEKSNEGTLSDNEVVEKTEIIRIKGDAQSSTNESDNTNILKAKLTIYADDKTVFSADVYPTDFRNFTLDVENCKRLGIVFESYPETESFCLGMVNGIVEK